MIPVPSCQPNIQLPSVVIFNLREVEKSLLKAIKCMVQWVMGCPSRLGAEFGLGHGNAVSEGHYCLRPLSHRPPHLPMTSPETFACLSVGMQIYFWTDKISIYTSCKGRRSIWTTTNFIVFYWDYMCQGQAGNFESEEKSYFVFYIYKQKSKKSGMHLYSSAASKPGLLQALEMVTCSTRSVTQQTLAITSSVWVIWT